MSGAICRTCGGANGQHIPSLFDPHGIGNLGHRMQGGHPSLDFRGRPMIIAPQPIQAADFDTLEELRDLSDKQGLPIILVNEKAWHKYEGMISKPV